MSHFSEIRAFLSRVRRRALGHALARYLQWLLVALVVGSVGTALIAGSGGLATPRSVRIGWAAMAGVFTVGLAVFTVVRTAWLLRGEVRIARAVEDRVQGLLGAVRTAVELERELPSMQREPVFSVELVHAQAAATAERLRSVDVASSWPLLPSRRTNLLAMGATVAALSVAVLAWSTTRAGFESVVLGRSASAIAVGTSGPLVGDLRVRLVFPAYASLPPREVIASTGDVTALRGTIVEIEAVAVRDAGAAAVAFEDGSLVPLALEGRTVRGSFTVDRTVAYRFALGDAVETLEAEGALRTVTVEDDLYPEVDIIHPRDDITLSDRDTLEIEATARDDHGITRVEVVFEPRDGTDAIVREVAVLADPTVTWNEVVRVSLSELGLKPGDEVRYRVEVTDNDLISGPKRGTSTARVLEIFSARKAHDAVMETHEQVVRLLVGILGDRIEKLSPAGERLGGITDETRPGPLAELKRMDGVIGEVHGRTRTAIESLNSLAAMLREDPLASKDVARRVSNAGGRLDTLLRDEVDAIRIAKAGAGRFPGDKRARALIARVRSLNARAVKELEGTVVFLDDLLHRERLEDLLAAGDELARARDELRDLISAFKETEDPALKARIARELEALKRKMAEMAARMAALRSSIPDEFINRDAVTPMKGSLERIGDLIDEGKLDEALAELDSMTEAMESMLSELGGGVTDWTEERFGGRNSALGRLADEVDDLAAREAEIERRATAIDEKRLARAKDAVRDALDKAARKAEGKLDKIESALEKVESASEGASDEVAEAHSRATGKLELLKRALRSGDIGGAAEEADALSRDLEDLGSDLGDDAEGALKKGDAAGLRAAAKASRGAAGTAKELAGELGKLAPDPEKLLTPGERGELRALSGKQAELEKRAADVEKKLRDVGPMGGEASDARMGEVRRHMKGAGSHLKNGETRKGKVEAETAAEKLRRLADGLREERGGSSGGGSEGPGSASDDREKVEIPAGEDHKAPKELREDILKAMKESAPDRYRAIVRRYYEELVK